MKKPIVLIVKDGWGMYEDYPGNAVLAANTPNDDMYSEKYPRCIISTSGEAVGLRPFVQGNSEVGHLNIGAGRIVEQELVRVDKFFDKGEADNNEKLNAAIQNCIDNDSKFHLMGLVQDQGVHAHEDHFYKTLEYLKKKGLKKVYVHFYADGRDTPPRSAQIFMEKMETKMEELGTGKIGSVIGRYYAMDRGENWDRTKLAYDALLYGEGLKASSGKAAIEAAYGRADKTLESKADELVETDEFIKPTLIESNGGLPGLIEPKDSVLHLNFRQDRAFQLTKAFVDDDFTFFERKEKLDVYYLALTKYYDELEDYIIPPMNIQNTLGEILSRANLWQLRIAEFQKFRHVTSFFNSKRIEADPMEDRVLVESISIPENQKPEMSAYEVTEAVLCAINEGIQSMREKAKSIKGVTLNLDKKAQVTPESAYDVIILNYANCDMVGHTGDMKAAMKAVETVDKCVGQVVDAVLAKDGVLLITADHGNVENMIDPKTGGVQTSHTNNDVYLSLIGNDVSDLKLREKGILGDIAPTMLKLMDLPIPPEMTGESLI